MNLDLMVSEDFFMFSLYVYAFHVTPTPWQSYFRPQGHDMNTGGRGPLDDMSYQILRL